MDSRLITTTDLDDVADVLTNAFVTDPTGEFLFPDPVTRTAGMRAWFAVMAQAGLRRGHSYVSSNRLAASLWVPPDTNLLDKASGAKLIDAVEPIGGSDSVERMLALGEATGALHPHHTPHFYLMFVGVAEVGRGRGWGSSVISSVLKMCDHMQFPAYLEATTQRAVPFYERLGFSVIHDVLVTEGMSFTGMWRDPRPPTI